MQPARRTAEVWRRAACKYCPRSSCPAECSETEPRLLGMTRERDRRPASWKQIDRCEWEERAKERTWCLLCALRWPSCGWISWRNQMRTWRYVANFRRWWFSGIRPHRAPTRMRRSWKRLQSSWPSLTSCSRALYSPSVCSRMTMKSIFWWRSLRPGTVLMRTTLA